MYKRQCQYFGLAHSGAVAPGYTADLIVLSNLEQFTVEPVSYTHLDVYKRQGILMLVILKSGYGVPGHQRGNER